MSSNRPRAWSLRTRLLWQLVLAIGLLLGGLFLVLDVLVDRAMFRQLDQFLDARASALAQQLQVDDDPRAHILPAWDIAGHTDFFAIYDAGGHLRAATSCCRTAMPGVTGCCRWPAVISPAAGW